MRSPDVGGGGRDLPGHAHAAGGLVPGHVLVVEPEERSQCPGAAEGAGVGQLQNGVAWLHKLIRNRTLELILNSRIRPVTAFIAGALRHAPAALSAAAEVWA